MIKPRFQCSTYDVSPEHPSDWEVVREVSKSSLTSLGGTLMEDSFYRKYTYVLIWEAMSDSDFDDLEELVNYSIDNAENITFTYRKWSQSFTGTTVRAELPTRRRRGGSGEDNYYSIVTLTLREVSA